MICFDRGVEEASPLPAPLQGKQTKFRRSLPSSLDYDLAPPWVSHPKKTKTARNLLSRRDEATFRPKPDESVPFRGADYLNGLHAAYQQRWEVCFRFSENYHLYSRRWRVVD